MADLAASELITPGAITAGAGALSVAGRWALRLWAQVRRESIVAAADAAAKREAFEAAAAAAQRADNARMVEALIEQARSNAALVGELAKSNAILGGKLDHVAGKLDRLVEQREWTPVDGIEKQDLEDSQTRGAASRRARTPALGRPGYRPPRAGTHNDE